MTEKSIVLFGSFNTRGLGDVIKRKLVFNWLLDQHKGVFCLQETHSTPASEAIWRKQWRGQMAFSHGESNSCGVAILFPPDLVCEIKESMSDEEGRIVLTEVEIEGQNLILCNIYAPTKDKKGGKVERQSEYAIEVSSLQEEFQFVEIWRLRHPTARRFTRRENTIGGFVLISQG